LAILSLIMPFWNAPETRANEALRRAIDQSLAVISFDTDGKILGANANFLAAVGYRDTEVVGRHHRMFVDDAYGRSEAYKAFWASLKAGRYEEGEFRRVAAGGREIWLRATYNPIVDDVGKVLRIVKIATDITAEKNRAIDEAGQIAAIQRSQAVISFAMDGTILEANNNFLSSMGYSRDEVIGKHHRLFVPPEDANSAGYEHFWASLRRGEFQTAEYRRIGKGGREVWIRASYNPILDVDSKPIKVVKFAMDVTAEKARTADYEGQIAAINRTQAVITFTLDGNIVDANQNFLSAVGYDLDEIKGHHHRMFVKPDYAESQDYKEFWERLRAGDPVSAIYQRFGKGGKVVWLQATYNPILDPAGRPVKVVKYATDITTSMGARSRAVEAAEDTLNNVENVASAAEELNASASSIADGMVRTKQAVDEIHVRTTAADRSTIEMRQAAQSMTSVVDLINQIAGQINLLALNATIESARAGEAGRGFAVVANEVKILANQTSAATSRITGEISAMQNMSDQVVEALASITSVVGDVQGFVDDATHSMQEQSQVTQEISANMHVAAGGVADIGRSLDDWIVGMEERRFETRVRTAKPGVIVCKDGTRLTCSLRNVSKGGAKLVVTDTRTVPDFFDLEVPEDNLFRKCTVVRRGKAEMGIRFVDQAGQLLRDRNAA
jgi:methyl-accepting chemotaxis protein